MVIYKCLPPTSALAELLAPRKKITRLDQWERALLGVMGVAAIVVVACIVLIKWDWLPKRETSLAGLIFAVVLVLVWLVSAVMELVQNAGTIFDPAKELAEQFDRDMAMESELVPCFRAIPAVVLTARHQRLESQLQVWEKWLDTTRLMGLIGPPLILVAKGTFGDFPPLRGAWSIEVMVAAFLTGVLLGSISFRSGVKSLHRVSSLLKRAAELRQTTMIRRRSRGRVP